MTSQVRDPLVSTDDKTIFTSRRGWDVLRHPRLNKAQSFTEEERNQMGVRGLIPSGFEDEALQVKREITLLRGKSSDLEKYLHLMWLLDRNESLFFRVLTDHIQECMPIVYTPTVGLACQKYSHIWTQPRGLYISYTDKGRVAEVLNNWPEVDVKVIVFTDGERILGLGDLGINGMGIPVGKLHLYAACGGIPGHQCLPVTIDVGTNTEAYLNDEFYPGLRHKRIRGKEFNELIEEFMIAAQQRFGKTVLLQFEDFGNTTAFELLHSTRDRFTTFNDDIQGTAAVTLAGLIASLKLTKKVEGGAKRLSEHVFVFLGAGEAGTGIAHLIAHAIREEARLDGKELSVAESRANIWLIDSVGLITKKRAETGKLAHHKLDFAHPHDKELSSLLEVVKDIKATSIIGVSATPNTFTKEVCEQMAKNCVRPLIFALSNPTSKAECTARQAYEWTQGQAIYASGSPFDPVDIFDKKRIPGQGNNAYIFPGLGLGIIASGAKTIPDDLLYISATSLADQVTDQDLEYDSVYPALTKIREVSFNIAVAIAEAAWKSGLATVPQPEDIRAWVESRTSRPVYRSVKSPL